MTSRFDRDTAVEQVGDGTPVAMSRQLLLAPRPTT